MKVLTEVLTRKFKGIIVCDGWKPYAWFTNRIQRCWAYLLQESKEIAEKFEEAIPLHNMLKELYEILTEALENDPPPKVRKNLWKLARKVLRQWIRKVYSIEKVRKFIGKIKNGIDYWFTFIINPGVEPTNNRAERALRPLVVLRKILGTLRNDKGTSIHERINANREAGLLNTYGKVNPYGVYDISRNEDWVSVGTDHDTSAFAVESIRQWWNTMGKTAYPDARKLLITADSGGSNGYRVRLWKVELQKLADDYGLEISVSHFPPGTSKWNKIEHKLFSFITQNWRGKPLISHEVIVNLIAATTTQKGLHVECGMDKKVYRKGIKISDNELK
jgi:hypothetical protein